MKVVDVYDNFLNEEEISIVDFESLSKIEAKDTKFRTNLLYWQPEIVQQSTEVLIYDLSENDLSHKILNSACLHKFGKIPTHYMFYYWNNGSYIAWHNDGHSKNAATMYLNLNWNRDWGGFYLYETNGDYKCIFPKRNRFLLQHNHAPHATSIIAQGAPLRRTVQMFFM